MRIGLRLMASGDFTVQELQAQAAAARGFSSVWTNQMPGGWDPLGLLGSITDGPAELGTAVVPTYPRHPVVMAAEALTVQAQTGNRLTLGIGPSHELVISGWWGIPYTSPLRHTREYLEVLRPLLRGEHVKYSGEFFTVDTGLALRTPSPPVLVGALGPRMLEVARDFADGTIATWVRPQTVADYVVPRMGDSSRIVVMALVSVTDDPDLVRENIAREFETVGDLPAYRAMLDRGGVSGPADTIVVGSETAVRQEFDRYRDAGATDLIVSPLGSPEEQRRTIEAVSAM